MPPRYAYWTIITGGLPTAFRMTERDELLPTFRRIKRKHPDAEMKYFARGRLWNSQEEARVESERLRAEADARRGARAPSRGRAWRPGGDHQDPRQKFKDAKKVRNQDLRQKRFDRRHKEGAQPPHGAAPARRAPQSTRAPRNEWRDRPARGSRPPASGGRPWSDRPPRDRARQDDRGDQGFRGKPPAARDRPWNDRSPRTARPPSSGDRPWNDRPPRHKARQDGSRQDDQGGQAFRGKPPTARDRPWSDRGPRTRPPSSGDRPRNDRPPRHKAQQDGPRQGDRSGQAFRGKPPPALIRRPTMERSAATGKTGPGRPR